MADHPLDPSGTAGGSAAPAPVRVLIVDDHRLMRSGLRAALVREPGFDAVGEAATAEEAVPLARILRPDVVLMDLEMPGAGGLAGIAMLRQLDVVPRVLMVSMHAAPEAARQALAAGAAGYVLKGTAHATLAPALRRVADGGVWVDPVLGLDAVGPPVRPSATAS
ncbi:MAG TPA: response regulator transcription factor [Miltoncostaeaceae bacterium]|nr:response regulator transcription factor [Miltoncostaeaceae bacterium]